MKSIKNKINTTDERIKILKLKLVKIKKKSKNSQEQQNQILQKIENLQNEINKYVIIPEYKYTKKEINELRMTQTAYLAMMMLLMAKKKR